MSDRNRDEMHGCTPRELSILDRHEAGISAEDIAAEFKLKPSYVRQIIRMYSGSWRLNDDFEAMVRLGTMRLAEKIAATGKVWA